MAFNWGLAFAIGKAAHGVRKAVSGQMKSKDAGSAGLVDPTQSAMVNLMHRERRAMETGTSDSSARNSLSKDGKNIIRRGILGGKRDISQYSKLRADNERAIIEGRAGERLGILKSLTTETNNMADRSMDLVELQGDRERLKGEASKQTGSKNVMSQIPAIQEIIQGAKDKKSNDSEGSGNEKKKKNIELAKSIGSGIKSIFGASGGGGGKESTGGGSGGFMDNGSGSPHTSGSSF